MRPAFENWAIPLEMAQRYLFHAETQQPQRVASINPRKVRIFIIVASLLSAVKHRVFGVDGVTKHTEISLWENNKKLTRSDCLILTLTKAPLLGLKIKQELLPV